MGWEEDYKSERSCFCGKGTIVSWSESDDWNRSRGGEYLTCENCKQQYVYAFIYPFDASQMRSDGYAWITNEVYAEYQKGLQEKKCKRKELRIQELQQQLKEWKGLHSLKWFEMKDELLCLQAKRDTVEYRVMLEEFHQYEAKLNARHRGSTKTRRPSIGKTHYWHED